MSALALQNFQSEIQRWPDLLLLQSLCQLLITHPIISTCNYVGGRMEGAEDSLDAAESANQSKT